MLLLIASITSACGGSKPVTSESPESSERSNQTQAETLATSSPATNSSENSSTEPNNRPTEASEGFTFEKHDVLSSYTIVLTAEALGGPAKGNIERFESEQVPPEKAHRATVASSQNDYVISEESIVIQADKWVKPYGKEWQSGSSLADRYILMLNAHYLALSNGSVEKLDETTVDGIPAIHYRFNFETKSSRMTGEVWIANQSGQDPVPLKAFQEQMALDDQGTVIDDYRHVRIEYVVSAINTPITISPPA